MQFLFLFVSLHSILFIFNTNNNQIIKREHEQKLTSVKLTILLYNYIIIYNYL